MQKSETIGKLVTALVVARQKFEKIIKDKTAEVRSEKGAYRYRYADLASVLDATVDPLAANGLILTQWTARNEQGKPALETMLSHVSGEWMCGVMDLPPLGEKATPQQLGSLITYARRYSACAALGIASEFDDDDGKGAEKGAKGEGIDPKKLADFLAAIETAEDVERLKAVFLMASEAAKADKTATARVIAAKTARYKQLVPGKPANGGAR